MSPSCALNSKKPSRLTLAPPIGVMVAFGHASNIGGDHLSTLYQAPWTFGAHDFRIQSKGAMPCLGCSLPGQNAEKRHSDQAET